jgi:hypothetical protein
MAYNKKIHLRQNIDAIKLALQLDREQRQATTQERLILKAYSGFGGIKAILNPADKPEDIRYWTKSDAELFPMVQELHEVLRENSPTPEVYKRYVGSLKSSVLSAFYTPKPVTDALMDTLSACGIRPSHFLEPSAGTGTFISSFRETMFEANITAFEKDLLTGKILSHLYPDNKILRATRIWKDAITAVSMWSPPTSPLAMSPYSIRNCPSTKYPPSNNRQRLFTTISSQKVCRQSGRAGLSPLSPHRAFLIRNRTSRCGNT